MFKNAQIFRIKSAPIELHTLEFDAFANAFVECSPSQELSIGWTPPRGEGNYPFVESVGGQLILKLMFESKAVPASVIKRKLEERLVELEATTGRKPGKKERQEISEDVKLALLPMAFAKRSAVLVWIDREAGTLVLDAGSQARADEVITELVKAIDGLQVLQINTRMSPATAMAHWLTMQEAPAGFSVDRECELKACDESKSVVKYGRHALDIDEVRQHIADGKLPTKLALTWEGRVSFVLTEGLHIKKVEFLDGVFETIDVGMTLDDDAFDADVVIATGELRQLIPDLLLALGGEMVLDEGGAA